MHRNIHFNERWKFFKLYYLTLGCLKRQQVDEFDLEIGGNKDLHLDVDENLKHKIEIDRDEEEIKALALADERIIKAIADKDIRKFIFVPGKIINFVV